MAYFPVSLCKRTTISRIRSNDFVNINQHRLWRLFEQQADPTDDLGGTCRFCHDPRRSFACFLRVGVIAVEPVQAGGGIGNGGSKGLIQFGCQRVNSPIVVTRLTRASSA
jgi:hypothetical protein